MIDGKKSFRWLRYIFAWFSYIGKLFVGVGDLGGLVEDHFKNIQKPDKNDYFQK